MSGLFISFEGLDGSGKSTQLQLLEDRLRAEGIAYCLNREPGGDAIGQQIRQLILDPAHTQMSPVAELLLYFANRAQNVDAQIRPALERGELVISDRFTDSTMAYQGAGRGLGTDAVAALHQIACRGTEPEITIYLRVPLETALARRQGQVDDRLEAEPPRFHRAVFETYEQLALTFPHRIWPVDGTQPPLLVHEQIWSKIAALLEERRGV
ncbi:MAG: dTMP kinase [Bryobacter sp.]|nr:dTMP kinase [Bryobacter sp.]